MGMWILVALWIAPISTNYLQLPASVDPDRQSVNRFNAIRVAVALFVVLLRIMGFQKHMQSYLRCVPAALMTPPVVAVCAPRHRRLPGGVSAVAVFSSEARVDGVDVVVREVSGRGDAAVAADVSAQVRYCGCGAPCPLRETHVVVAVCVIHRCSACATAR